MNGNKKIGVVIQCTASDLYRSKDAEDYCTGVCKRNKLFDSIVLAVPDVREQCIR